MKIIKEENHQQVASYRSLPPGTVFTANPRGYLRIKGESGCFDLTNWDWYPDPMGDIDVFVWDATLSVRKRAWPKNS